MQGKKEPEPSQRKVEIQTTEAATGELQKLGSGLHMFLYLPLPVLQLCSPEQSVGVFLGVPLNLSPHNVFYICKHTATCRPLLE